MDVSVTPFRGSTLGLRETRRGTAQGRAVFLYPWGSGVLCHEAGAPSRKALRLFREVGVQRNVRLHALLGKKDGHTFTPNEEMKLDCQDLSEMVLTRCRLLSVYVNIYVKCEFMCGKSPVPLGILLSFCTPRRRGQSRPVTLDADIAVSCAKVDAVESVAVVG